MSDALNAYVRQVIQEQNQRVEDDLLAILGRRASWPPSRIRRLGYEVVWQVSPDAMVQEYRGIRRRGKWVIDHHPDWPFRDTPE